MRMANYEQKINYNQSKYSFNILAQTYDCNYHPIFKKQTVNDIQQLRSNATIKIRKVCVQLTEFSFVLEISWKKSSRKAAKKINRCWHAAILKRNYLKDRFLKMFSFFSAVFFIKTHGSSHCKFISCLILSDKCSVEWLFRTPLG